MVAVFDGHNDFLSRVMDAPHLRTALWREGDGTGHLDAKRCAAGGMAGGMFAIYVPSPSTMTMAEYNALFDTAPYQIPLPAPLDLAPAQAHALQMAGHFHAIAREIDGFTHCLTAAEIEATFARGDFAAVLHMEGAEAIDDSLDALHLFHAMGLRSLGPVWSRPTLFGAGVPFAYPATGDFGGGLTDAGKRLVAECNALKIMIDLSHLNEKGFDDVARLSDAPLVATHSNAHAICPSSRNLTDRQLAVIKESGGMVGVNFAVSFLRPDGRKDTAMGWDVVLRHIDHLIEKLGEDHVGLGSDFDGALLPDILSDAAALPGLIAQLEARGFGTELIEKLAHRNWINVLRRTWGA